MNYLRLTLNDTWKLLLTNDQVKGRLNKLLVTLHVYLHTSHSLLWHPEGALTQKMSTFVFP